MLEIKFYEFTSCCYTQNFGRNEGHKSPYFKIDEIEDGELYKKL